MTCRRRTKGERELIADIKKSAKRFCRDECITESFKHYGCNNCPILAYAKQYGSCTLGYVHYIFYKEKMEENNN